MPTPDPIPDALRPLYDAAPVSLQLFAFQALREGIPVGAVRRMLLADADARAARHIVAAALRTARRPTATTA